MIFKVSKFVFLLKTSQSIWSNDSKKNIFSENIFCQKFFFWKNIFILKKYFWQKIFSEKNIFFGIVGPNALKWLYKKDKFWSFKKSLFTKSFVNFSPFSPANMVPASGGNLSGGWNHAGLFSFNLILSELLLDHDIFKIDFISWAPTVCAIPEQVPFLVTHKQKQQTFISNIDNTDIWLQP